MESTHPQPPPPHPQPPPPPPPQAPETHIPPQLPPHPHPHRDQPQPPPPHSHRRHRDKDGERTGFKVKIPGHRSTRYKEKFQALRERYDRVVAIQDDHQRDLDIAAAKMKRLQAENDLLLDAIYVSAPELMQLVDPVSPYDHPHANSHHPTPIYSPGAVEHDYNHSYPQNHAHNHNHPRAHAQTVVENGHAGSGAGANGVGARSRVGEPEDHGHESERGQSPYDDHDGRV